MFCLAAFCCKIIKISIALQIRHTQYPFFLGLRHFPQSFCHNVTPPFLFFSFLTQYARTHLRTKGVRFFSSLSNRVSLSRQPSLEAEGCEVRLLRIKGGSLILQLFLIIK